MKLRPVQPEDNDSIIRLIGDIYTEYGFRICLRDAESDLVDIAKHYQPGSFMVLVDDTNAVRGTVALVPCSERKNVSWLKRLYLDSSLRGDGHADRLLAWAIEKSLDNNRTQIELWSDTEFDRAHSFYKKHGFIHDGTVRHMTDGHDPYDEYFFSLKIDS
jgi:GNAT superfamily N-acetyltransferase